MDLKPIADKLKDSFNSIVLAAIKPALKPFLKSFAHAVIDVLKVEAAKTKTPLDDMALQAAEAKVDELIEKMHEPELKV